GVPAGVRVEVDVTGLFEPAPDGLRGRVVVFVRGADEPVEGRAEGAPGVAEVLRAVIGEFLGCDVELVRRLQHLQPVLIRAGAEEDLVIVQSFEPGDRVGRNVLIGVPDVNGPVRVGNRCRQVVTHRPFSLRDTPLPARTGPLGTRGDPVGRRAGAIRREWWGGPQESSAESSICDSKLWFHTELSVVERSVNRRGGNRPAHKSRWRSHSCFNSGACENSFCLKVNSDITSLNLKRMTLYPIASSRLCCRLSLFIVSKPPSAYFCVPST